MNILASRTLKISSLALSLLLASCGDNSAPTESDSPTGDKQPSGQVIARVNGEEITIYELNGELSRVKITDETREAMSRNMLKSLVVRTIFEQNAKKNKLDRSPNIMMELERSKATILAKAYLQSQLVKKSGISRSEIEAYIFDNPHFFANRAYYTFDTIVLSNEYLTKDRREKWELVTNLDEIESTLLQEGIDYKRMPYTAYSETLPAGILDDMPELKSKGDVFFIVMKNVSYLNIYRESRPAVLTGEKAHSAAERRLASKTTKEFLVGLEAEALAAATIEYLGDYKDLLPATMAPDSIEVTGEEIIGKEVSDPSPTQEKE